MTDTIVAIATAVGEAAIGIVRLSGKEAVKIAALLFTSRYGVDLREAETHKLYLGNIKKTDGTLVDEVLVSVMRAPHSYTTEDVVEINCHGGITALYKVLELTIEKGARLAEPGEFTKRAFLNGRLDLAQAEAVIDAIRAKTSVSLQVSVQQLGGRLSGEIKRIRSELLDLLARLEVVVDFPDEDVQELAEPVISGKVKELKNAVKKLLDTAKMGTAYREGVKTAFVGKVNVGKSSLLNALLNKERAIVTDIPGTTRDVVEDFLNLKGVPVIILDTAGIRQTDDPVENIGVKRALSVLDDADLVLVVLDAGTGLTAEDQEVLQVTEGKTRLILLNKIDLSNKKLTGIQLKKIFPKEVIIEISARLGQGLDRLSDRIFEMVVDGEINTTGEEALITRKRHLFALKQVYSSLTAAENSIKAGQEADFVAVDLREAWLVLGEITGEVVDEEILEHIFKEFCIGK